MPTTMRALSQDPTYYHQGGRGLRGVARGLAGQPDRALWAQYQGELGNALLMSAAPTMATIRPGEGRRSLRGRADRHHPGNNADSWARNQVQPRQCADDARFRLNDNRMLQGAPPRSTARSLRCARAKNAGPMGEYAGLACPRAFDARRSRA